MEATILKWVKREGEPVEVDETILEIATDKVDSDIPSPVQGIVKKILFKEDEIVQVGKTIAIIQTAGAASSDPGNGMDGESSVSTHEQPDALEEQHSIDEPFSRPIKKTQPEMQVSGGRGSRFYSPLVRNIAKKESISLDELDSISGSGLHGRVTKRDILEYIASITGDVQIKPQIEKSIPTVTPIVEKPEKSITPAGSDVEVIEMDRMRKLTAEHMVNSKRISAHVTSFIEIDVTNIVEWRNQVKADFYKKYLTNLTFTPIFIEATARALRDYPMINISVDGNNIVIKKNINIGMATALASGNLIVPVIKHADQYNIVGLATRVNDLADRARKGQLKPDEIQGGTFTLTNVGVFGNLMGTPIINQPEVAILATGAIRKKPAVIESEQGDSIGIRHMMFLSLSYDHRVIDGFSGGSFLKRIGDYLEDFTHDANL